MEKIVAATPIVQSDVVTTAIAGSVPVVTQENFSKEDLTAIIANFLRTGSPAVQYLPTPFVMDPWIDYIDGRLSELCLKGESFKVRVNENVSVATFTRQIE